MVKKFIQQPFTRVIIIFMLFFFPLSVHAQLTTKSNTITTRVGSPSADIITPVSPDGEHVCPLVAQFIRWPGAYTNIGTNQMSWVCEHCHDRNTFRSIDMGTSPSGGTPVVAIVSGVATKLLPPASQGRAIILEGDDGFMYFYQHLADWEIPNGSTRVTMGQIIGTVAAASDTGSANNSVAHLHIQTTTNGDNYHPNTFIGPLLDEWCGVSVCNGTQTSCGYR